MQCGATTINVPDTVGYALPLEFGDFVRELYRLAPSLNDVHVSVHCHNDLGCATADSLAAVHAGATQVKCAVDGIRLRARQRLARRGGHGDRRAASAQQAAGLDTKEITRTSGRLVTGWTGYAIPSATRRSSSSNAFAPRAASTRPAC